MRIRELEEEGFGGYDSDEIETMSTKRVLVGLGARVLFYPTLMYNVLRNKIQSEFRWWDEVDQYLLLGAVPFQKDVLHLQKLGVKGVVTLNEPYETLVPSSLYKAHGIDHLVIPTRDYFFAPSLINISRAVDFIHRNASCGSTTYVHCKAGRGRSTTIVLCYLIEYKNMTPADALEYVHSRRPRILLTPSQWQAVQEYSKRRSEFPALQSCSQKSIQVDDTVLITEADLEGYATSEDCFEDHMILLNSEKVIPAEISPAGSLLEDGVLITEKDLEGYDSSSSDKGSDDKRPSLFGISSSRSKISKLSCLFSSLKFSSSSSPSASSRVQEIRAC